MNTQNSKFKKKENARNTNKPRPTEMERVNESKTDWIWSYERPISAYLCLFTLARTTIPRPTTEHVHRLIMLASCYLCLPYSWRQWGSGTLATNRFVRHLTIQARVHSWPPRSCFIITTQRLWLDKLMKQTCTTTLGPSHTTYHKTLTDLINTNTHTHSLSFIP